jgi:hypothetical protein
MQERRGSSKTLVLTIIVFILFLINNVSISSININLKNVENSTNTLANSGDKWTFIAYLDGDDSNLEEDLTRFINDMEKVGPGPNVDIVVLADDYTCWDQHTKRFEVQYDPGPGLADYIEGQTAWTLDEKNMGDPQTLIDFACWAIDEYPADRYCLAIFNYGSGWMGVCNDVTDYSRLEMDDFKFALSEISGYIGKKLDILVYEACTMGMVEVVYQIKDYVDISISSQIPMNWHYISFREILNTLTNHPEESSEVLAKRIVDLCYYEDIEGTLWHRLFGIKMYMADDLALIAQGLANMGNLVMDSLLGFNYKTIRAIRDASVAFPNIAPAPHDLYMLADNFLNKVWIDLYGTGAEDAKKAIAEWKETIKEAVIRPTEEGKHYIEEGLHGVSIYFPHYKEAYYPSYKALDFSYDCQWDEFLTNYFRNSMSKNKLFDNFIFRFNFLRNFIDLLFD